MLNRRFSFAGSDPWPRARLGLMVLVAILAIGTVGYLALGLSTLEALYYTVITVSTVGFSEPPGQTDDAYRLFTILLILGGTGTVLYILGVLLEVLIEGRLTDEFRRQRMQRQIDQLTGHVIVCGYGQVGRAIAEALRVEGSTVVVVDRLSEPLREVEYSVIGDATDDEILLAAGVERATTIVVAMDHDTDNLFATLSARSIRADLVIVARATAQSSESKLRRAGADRVVNPHEIGGTRMAAFVLQPHVADFLGVVMQDNELSLRLEEFEVGEGSTCRGETLEACSFRETTGSSVLAVRSAAGQFDTNPSAGTVLDLGDVLLAFGTEEQLKALSAQV
jgi:voltage-gated potassium channel